MASTVNPEIETNATYGDVSWLDNVMNVTLPSHASSNILGDEWGVNVIPIPIRTTLIAGISFLVIFSNLLNMIVLRMTVQIPAISRTCLLNLSLADMLVGVVSCLPCVYPAITGVWPFGDVLCQIAAITHGVSVTMSIWSLALVSVDRYIAILHPLRYHVLMTPFRCKLIICCMWTFATLTFAMPLPTKPYFIYYRFSISEMMCGLYWEYPWFCVVTAVYIPVFAGTTLAVTTWKIVRQVLHMAKNQVAPQLSSGTSSSGVSKSDVKAVKVLVITAVTYFTVWGPYVTEVVLISFVRGLAVPSLVRFTTIWMANSNSFMNVIIYSVMYSSFRKNCIWIIKATIARMFCQEPPEKPSDN